MSSLVHSPAAHTQPGKSKTVADILTAAADLIDKPGAWTQNYYARDRTGQQSFCSDPEAVCWCVFGAITKVSAEAGADEYEVDAAFRRNTGIGAPATWNDAPERTQAEVVAALRQAAEKARQAVSS